MAKQFFGALVALLVASIVAGCGSIEFRSPIVHTPQRAEAMPAPVVEYAPPVAQPYRAAAPAATQEPAWWPVPGKQYAYATGLYLHLEFRVVLDTLNVRKAFDEYHTEHAGHKPVAYMALVSKKTRAQAPGFKFANCGLRADIRIDGMRLDPATYQNAEFPVLDRNRRMIGTVRPVIGPNFLEFRNFDLRDGVVNVVIPYAFEGNPVMTLRPLNWRGVGRFYQNGAYVIDFSHRLNNSGFIPETIVDPASVKGRCHA